MSGDESLLNPRALLGPQAPLAAAAVMLYDPTHAPRRNRRRDPAPFRMIVGPQHDVATIVAAGPGAPTAAITVEFLAHLGVRSIIAVGVAGAIDPALEEGSIVVIDRAVSDEGTSARYGPARPDPVLTSALASRLDCPAAATVSTDTPLRQSATDLARWGVEAAVIEMEAAALFAAARVVGVQAAAAIVVSDRFEGLGGGAPKWSMGNPIAVRRVVRSVVKTAGAVLESQVGGDPP